MNDYDRRLRHLAQQLGLCPTYAEPLVCAWCEYEADPLPPEEALELLAYYHRVGAGPAPGALHSPCATCGAERLCLACQQASGPALDLARLTCHEQARYIELRDRLNFRPKADNAD
jgi:hypothetical protein